MCILTFTPWGVVLQIHAIEKLVMILTYRFWQLVLGGDLVHALQAEETASAAYNAAAPPVPQPRLMPVARSTPNLLAAAAAGAAGAAKTISQPVVRLSTCPPCRIPRLWQHTARALFGH